MKKTSITFGICLMSSLSYAQETAEQVPGDLGESLALALIVAIGLVAVCLGKFP
jgi:hypothetical protein